MLSARLKLPGKLLLLHCVLATAVFFSFGGYRNEPAKIESDGKYYYQFLVSLWFDGDLDFANNYRQAKKPFMAREVDHYGFADQLTPTGRPTNLFTIGPAVLWSPFFAAAYGVGSALSVVGATESPPDGWERPFQLAVMFSAVVYSALALVLLYRLLIEHFEQRVVLTGLAVLFWGTNWLYYCVFEPSMSHVYDLFSLVLLIWLCRRAVRLGGGLLHLAVGLAAGLHVLVRTQNLASVFALLLFFWLLSAVAGNGRSRFGDKLRHGALLLVALAIALVPLAAANLALFGEVVVVPQKQAGWSLSLASPNLAGVLFSAHNGLFSHHPVLLLAVGGLAWAAVRWRSHRGVLRLLLPFALVFCAQLWINGAADDWWGGHAFGQRRLMSSLPLFGLGFCVLQQVVEVRLKGGTRLVPAVFLLAVVMNLYLTLIHVFVWSYDEPHDILDWISRAPAGLSLLDPPG